MFTILVFLTGYCTVTSAFSVGAGEAACESMEPLHRMAPQQTDSPFSIQVLGDGYTPGEEITGAKISQGFPFQLTLKCHSHSFHFWAELSRFHGSSAERERRTSRKLHRVARHSNTLRWRRACWRHVSHSCYVHSMLQEAVTHSSGSTKESVNVTWVAPETGVGPVTFR